MKNVQFVFLAFLFMVFASCKDDTDVPGKSGGSGTPEITSSFKNGEFMPFESGKNNGNVSPPLTIKNVPDGTVELVLTMRDIDHNNSWHWAIWNIPKTKVLIEEGESWSDVSVTVGSNDYGTGYVGPFPPSEHRYEIKVYFLDDQIHLGPSFYEALPSTIEDKIIDEVSIIGRYD